ncbi:MAG: HD domain-containing protein [Candidatus ainarchaeum sp.]|nr:HD domain-containing protein [Candidatus ainarchaeum sp.]
MQKNFEDILLEARKFNPKADRKLLEKAFEFALEKQAAKKDSPAIQHILNVALLMAQTGTDDATIASALLHDTFLAGNTKREEINSFFGEEIAEIVEECAKAFQIEEKNFQNFSDELLSNVILAVARDIRAVLIILASAFDSLGSDAVLDENAKENFAKRCLAIFVPICDKLGLHQMKWQLEDSCFKALNPKEFGNIKALVRQQRGTREKEIRIIAEEISCLLKKEKIKASISGRPKHFFSIYKKMNLGKKFEELPDLRGIRLICDSIKQCYEILGVIHSNYTIVPQEFDDYIINPKENNYRGLHTVIVWQKKPVEIQIRTMEMHWDNETGLASHWAYKEYPANRYFDAKLGWGQAIIEGFRAKKKTSKFVDSLKIDFGEDKIFALTPKNKVVVLPGKSTPVDFAFAIHSDLGLKCQKAKANGKIVPLDYKIENADTIEIIPSQTVQVKRDWLGFAKSEKAKAKIRQKLGLKLPAIKKTAKPGKNVTTGNSNVKIAKCCNPLPGEEIIGLKTTKRKIIAHKADCENILKAGKEKIVQMDWEMGSGKFFAVKIQVKARESSSLLPGILNIISSSGASLVSTSAKEDKSRAVNALFNVRIQQAKQLEKIMQKIRKLPQVFEAERI